VTKRRTIAERLGALALEVEVRGFVRCPRMWVFLPCQLFGVPARGDYKSGKKIIPCSNATNGVGKGWRVQANRGRRKAANRRVAKVGFARKVLFLRAASKAWLLRPTEEGRILRPAGIPISFCTRRSPGPFGARLRFCGPRMRPGSYGPRKRAGSCAPRRRKGFCGARRMPGSCGPRRTPVFCGAHKIPGSFGLRRTPCPGLLGCWAQGCSGLGY
jgi:hypothetical protein